MKATIDIPDDLYRRVKAKSALRGQAVREVVVGLFQGWITEGTELAQTPLQAAGGPLPGWFGAARKYAQRVARHDMVAVRRSIAQGRAHVGDGNALRKRDPS
jgi:hypothetical protein